MNSTGNTIQTLEWYEHIRLNPEMYIGRIGDGSDVEDGIYTLLKGLIDSSADEFEMGYAKRLEIEISGLAVSLRIRPRNSSRVCCEFYQRFIRWNWRQKGCCHHK